MSIIIILLNDTNIIYLEFYENNPIVRYSLNILMFNFVVISYKYTYLDVSISKYLSFGDNAIYLKYSS